MDGKANGTFRGISGSFKTGFKPFRAYPKRRAGIETSHVDKQRKTATAGVERKIVLVPPDSFPADGGQALRHQRVSKVLARRV